MKYLMLMLLCVIPLVTGCNLGCDAETLISEKLADAVASAATCSNVAAIQTDILSAINVVKLCAASDKHSEQCTKYQLPKGPIANVVCPLASSAVVAVAGNVIPARYGCQLSGSPLSSVVLQACLSLPF